MPAPSADPIAASSAASYAATYEAECEATYEAMAVLPYEDTRNAARGLRAELRYQVATAGMGVPDWSSLVLTRPVQVCDGRGRRWFEYTAVVRGQGGTEVAAVPRA